jgi:uncharacterized phage-associated protein
MYMNQIKAINLIKLILTRLDGGVADFWKIYKLLYFIDFENYKNTKNSITNADYYNWEYGPLPYQNRTEYQSNLINLIKLGAKQKVWSLINSNSIQIKNFENLNDSFDPRELLTIDTILDKYSKLTGKELVALSHEDMPYLMTKTGEKIDYEYVFWRETSVEITDITNEILSNPNYA